MQVGERQREGTEVEGLVAEQQGTLERVLQDSQLAGTLEEGTQRVGSQVGGI